MIKYLFQHPWAVGSMLTAKGNTTLHCSGTIIHPNFIISAAHCFDFRGKLAGTQLSQLSVILGAEDLSLSDFWKKIKKIEERGIESVKLHPKYKHPTAYFDIAVGKLSKSVTFTEKIHPICLPPNPVMDPNHLAGKSVKVIGYANYNKSDTSLRPTELKDTVLPKALCNNKHTAPTSSPESVKIGQALPDAFNNPSVICAGDIFSNHGTCEGDSGKHF